MTYNGRCAVTRHFYALLTPVCRGERRERHLPGGAFPLETSGVRLCARRPTAAATSAPGGCWGQERTEGRSGERLPEGGQSGRRRGRMLCPRARPLAPPWPRAGTHAEGMGQATGERRRGIRPPLSPPRLALQPPPPSLSFSSQGRLAARSRSEPAPRAAPLDNVTSPPVPPPLGSGLSPREVPRSHSAQDPRRLRGRGTSREWGAEKSHYESNPCLLPP